MHRRTFLALSAGTLATGLSTEASAQAAAWPNRPVKVILSYAPGGATDAVGRPWADKLGQAFRPPSVVENRGGAGRRGGAGAGEVDEDGLHGAGVLDGDDDAQPVAREHAIEGAETFPD